MSVSDPNFHLEVLETRIAPANLFVGATEPVVLNSGGNAVQTTSYNVDYGVDAAVFLRAGDTLVIDSNDNLKADKTEINLASVTSGYAWLFFRDFNEDGHWDQNEISGVSFGAAPGKSFAAIVNGTVGGSIVGNAKLVDSVPGILANNDLSMTAVSKLSVTGLVMGQLLSGGSISNVTISGALDHISIIGIQTGWAAVSSVNPNPYSSSLIPESYAFGLATKTLNSFADDVELGAAGPSISNIKLAGAVASIETGPGFSGSYGFKTGGRGGSISNVTIEDGGGLPVVIHAGGGGMGGADEGEFSTRSAKGGNGGSISGITASHISGLAIFSGQGGDGPEYGASSGGNGGSISKITVSNITENFTLLLAAAKGGDGSYDYETYELLGNGGSSGSISGIKVTGTEVSEVNLGIQSFAPGWGVKDGTRGNVSGVTVTLPAGSGGHASQVIGKIYSEGAISGLKFNVQAELNLLAKRSISNLRLAGGTLQAATGDMVSNYYYLGDRAGINGGDIKDIVSTGTLSAILKTGDGSDGSGYGAGGRGGNVSNVTLAEVGSLIIETGSAGTGGFTYYYFEPYSVYIDPVYNSNGDVVREGYEQDISGYRYLHRGAGGAGGSISNIVLNTATDLYLSTGDGGNTAYEGKGGNGGSIENLTVKNGVTTSAYLATGDGGSYYDDDDALAGPGVIGGSGGSIKNIKLTVLDAVAVEPEEGVVVTPPRVALFSGTGGDGMSRGAGGHAGSISGVTVTFAATSAPVQRVILQGGNGGAGGEYEVETEDYVDYLSFPQGNSGHISGVIIQDRTGAGIGDVSIAAREEGNGDYNEAFGVGGLIANIKISTTGALEGLKVTSGYGEALISAVSITAGSVDNRAVIEGSVISGFNAELRAAPMGIDLYGDVVNSTLTLKAGQFGSIWMEYGSFKNVKIVADAEAILGDINLAASDGYSGDYIIGPGESGGSISGFSLTAPGTVGHVSIYSGNGSEGLGPSKNGGNGGSLSGITLNAPSALVTLYAGYGGDSEGGTGGAGGSISNVKGVLAGLSVSAGDGGWSEIYTNDADKDFGGAGGNGGSVSGITLTSLGVEVEGIAVGFGGVGELKTGKNGKLSNIHIPGYVPGSGIPES